MFHGATYLITKKTNDGLFWLRPDETVNAVLLYLLLLKVRKYRLQLHAAIAMSNHIHILVTDRYGRLPDFTREFFSESAKALKIHHLTDRTIWEGDRYGSVQLLDRDAGERFIAYVILNPENAHLTLCKEWPGLTTANVAFGGTIVAKRPGIYFSDRRPEWVEAVLEPLPEAIVTGIDSVDEALEELEELEEFPAETPEEWAHRCREQQRRIDERVAEQSRELAREREEKGKTLAGRERVLGASPTERAPKPFGTLNPRFATKNRELLERAIECEREFRKAHQRAKEQYIAGHTEVVFPYGTYGYRWQLEVRVAEGGLAA